MPLSATSQAKWEGESGNYRPHTAVVGDINADGKDDIAFGKGHSVTLLYGSATSADLDLDTDLGPRVLRLTLPSGASVADVEPAGDFDDDGRDDFVISTGSNAYVFYGQPGTATGTLAVVGSGRVTDISALGERSEGIGDFDGDGIDDLAVGRLNGAAVVYGGARANAINANVKGTRASAITATQTCGYVLIIFKTCSYDPISFSPVGDFNGDGKADLAVNSNSVEFARAKRNVLFGRSGTFSASAGTPTSAMALPAALGEYLPTSAGDVNGDGRGDLWYQGSWAISPGVYGAQILLGVETPPAALDRATSPKVSIRDTGWGIAIGDQDGDGRPDVAVGYGEGATFGTRTVGLPTGSGGIVDTSAATQVTGLPVGSEAIDAGDFDGDSVDDLLFQSVQSGQNRFVLATRGADSVPSQLTAASMTPVRFPPSTGTRFAVVATDAATLELTYRQNDATVASEQRTVVAGPSEVRFSGSVGSTILAPGSYTVEIVPVDAAGNRGAARAVTFELLPESDAAAAKLFVKATVVVNGVVEPLSYPARAFTYRATCGAYTTELRQGHDVAVEVGADAGLRGGDRCTIDASLTDGGGLERCTWTDTYAFNGTPGAAGTYQLRAGENQWVLTRSCALTPPEFLSSFDDFKRSGNATGYGGLLSLTQSVKSQIGSGVDETQRDYNGKTIEFDAHLANGNGAAEGITMAFLTGGPNAAGAYLGGGGQMVGFGGLPGVALVLDVSKGPNDPMGNFIGWADGVRGSGLNWLQTADAGTRLRGTNWVKVKMESSGGKVRVFINGTLRMERTMTLPTKARLGFTAATNDATWEEHLVRGLKIS